MSWGIQTVSYPIRYHRSIICAKLNNDVTHDSRYIPTRGMDDVCTELAVPVVVGDRLLGVLNVESTRSLDEEDAVDLAIVAD